MKKFFSLLSVVLLIPVSLSSQHIHTFSYNNTLTDSRSVIVSPNTVLQIGTPEITQIRSYRTRDEGNAVLIKFGNKVNKQKMRFPKNLISPETRIYPNPFNHVATVEFKHAVPDQKDQQYRFLLYDLTGKEVSIFSLDYQNTDFFVGIINKAGLSPGMYVYVIKSCNEEVVYSGKLSIN